MDTDTPKKPLEALAARFESIATQLRARTRLATEEARRAWDRAHLERVSDELRTARDEARVQLKLAGKDARRALDRIDEKLAGLRSRASTELDRIATDAAERLDHLADALRGGRTRSER